MWLFSLSPWMEGILCFYVENAMSLFSDMREKAEAAVRAAALAAKDKTEAAVRSAASSAKDMAETQMAAARNSGLGQRAGELAGKIDDKFSEIAQTDAAQKIKKAAALAGGELRYQVENSNLAKQLSEATTAAMNRVHDMTDIEKHKWRDTVRATISQLPEAEAVQFLAKLQPAALVEALRVESAVDLIRSTANRSEIDFQPAEALYPGLIQHLASNIILESDSQTITRGVATIAIQTAPTQTAQHGMSM